MLEDTTGPGIMGRDESFMGRGSVQQWLESGLKTYEVPELKDTLGHPSRDSFLDAFY